MSVVVSDTSPLHYLVQCEAIGILPGLFTEVLISPAVFRELQHVRTPPKVAAWARQLPGWVKVQAPKKVDHSLNADHGEQEAISLALEVNAAAILIDDKKDARKQAASDSWSRARSVCLPLHPRAASWTSAKLFGSFKQQTLELIVT